MANVDIKTAIPLAGTSIASDDRLALGDVSADGWVPVVTDTLLQALARVCSATLVLPQNLTVQQPGGTPGTHEVRISHTGASGGLIDNRSGFLEITSVATNLSVSGGGVVSIVGGMLLPKGGGIDGWNGNQYGFALSGDVSNVAGLKSPAAKVIQINDGSTGGGTLSSVPLTPAQITGNVNDYAPGTARYYRLSSDASHNVTGFVAGVNGQECWFVNVGAQNIVLKHQDSGSTAANQFLCDTGADVTLAPAARASLVYDGTTQRWRVYG